MSAERPVIVHLAIDVNTPMRPPTTNAIDWFVKSLDDMDNVVIAYQRHAWPTVPAPTACVNPNHRLYHFPFVGLRFGIGLLVSMRHAGRRTIAFLEREGIRPDLVHAHKLSFEGIAGWFVARHFKVPLFVSLRGEVETKVFRRKRRLRRLLRQIATDARRLYFVSAWFRDEFYRYVPAQPEKERLLPNIVRNIAPVISTVPPNDAFVSVFNLETWRRKGLVWLLDGIQIAALLQPALRLDIIGGGSEATVQRIKAMIAARGLTNRVTLVGALTNTNVLAQLPRYRALLLPSLNETFGMVYVEALFAGIPVMFTEGTAIDGYLDRLGVARAVPPRDAGAIATAIIDLWNNWSAIRDEIETAAPILYSIFNANDTLTRYRVDITDALNENH